MKQLYRRQNNCLTFLATRRRSSYYKLLHLTGSPNDLKRSCFPNERHTTAHTLYNNAAKARRLMVDIRATYSSFHNSSASSPSVTCVKRGRGALGLLTMSMACSFPVRRLASGDLWHSVTTHRLLFWHYRIVPSRAQQQAARCGQEGREERKAARPPSCPDNVLRQSLPRGG